MSPEPSPPPSPEGYGEPVPFPRSRIALEAASLLLLVALALATGLHHRVAVASSLERVVVVGAVVGVVVAHEGVHYLASLALGYAPVFELVPPRVYSLDTWAPRRDGFVTLLAPLVVLDAAGLLAWTLSGGPAALVGLVVVVVNTVASLGDAHAVTYLLTRASGTRTIVVERSGGLREYVAEPVEERPATVRA